VVFTSANGVEHFWAALEYQGLDSRALGGVRVCALGPATAAELARRGVRADLVPEEYVAEATVAALAAAVDLRGARILLPRAEVARAVLPDSLRERGAEVVEVAAYRTVQDGAGADDVKRRIAAGEVDLVTFTASSTVHNFAELVGADTGGAAVASIGPITSGTLRELGMRVDVEAKEYTIPGLLDAIRGFWT
jgi:uroporphyrinogen III methyltransferase/synthase